MLAASIHCACEAPLALSHSLSAATYRGSSVPLPLSVPHGCDNESGCLCRGATQAPAFDISPFTPANVGSSLPLAPPLTAPAQFSALGTRPCALDNPRPISGRQLRAHLASFVI